jgi:hypothetical protein
MGRNFCENRTSTVKGEVYFIQCGSLFKIGATKDLSSRFNAIQTANPVECKLIHSIKTNDMYCTERLFKVMFCRVNVMGEWFELTRNDIAYIKSGNYSQSIVNSIGNTDSWRRLPEIAIV